MSKSGRRLLGALKKVGSSSRSLERLNVYDWPTPPSSHEEAPVESHEEEAESQAPGGTTRGGARRLSPRHSRGPRDPSLNMLKNRTFNHTHGFDDELLEKICMDVEFARVWRVVGWSSFADVSGLGSRDLTIQFLCTLVEKKEGISF